MKRTRNLILLVSVLLIALCLASCGGSKVDSIRFDKAPRTVYVQGQDLDLSSAVITAVKGDKTEQIGASDVSVSGYNKDTLGKQTVTVSYGEVSTTLDVTVIPRIEVEGAILDYFVGDVSFDQSKGRIRVANDLGEVTTVALNDSGVTVSGFDATKAGRGIAVTLSYGGYTGNVSINIYDVASVKLTSFPTKKDYGSHETVFDASGAFFTVSAAGTSFERFVEINESMIKNFNPSAATVENIDTPLKQKVTISYLGNDFEFEISVKFSGVSLVQLRAKELASLTDFNNISADKGELALEAMRTYMKLDNAEKDFISDNDKNTVAKIAVIYGYDRFLTAKDAFSETAILAAVEQESGETIGMFSIIATSYEAAKRDLALMKDPTNEMIELGELLQSIKNRFGDLEIKDSKNAKDYLELLYTADGLDAAIDILTLITDLYAELSVVPTNWKTSDLEAYKSNIKTAVVLITGSDLNPFMNLPYIEVYQLLSKWREKDDYFDIIYAYYMQYEESTVIDSLWQVVPMPGKLQTIYTMLVSAANKTANISIGGDLTQFYYYYKVARECEDEILNGGNTLHINIFKKFNLSGLINAYMFVGNQMNNIGYIYYASSMAENKKFENLVNKYLDVLYAKNEEPDYTDKEVQAAVKELVQLYAELSPTEQFAFISAIHCDYRYNSFSAYLFETTLDDNGELKAANMFTYLLAKTYRELLTDDAWSVFTRLLTASEANACRFREEGKTEAFKEMMEEIIADAAKLSNEDKALFAALLDKMTLSYNECVTPSAPNAGAHQSKIDAILDTMDKFFDVSFEMNNSSITSTEKSAMSAVWLALAEKAKSLEDEIFATGDSNLIHTYLYCVYTFDTDRDDNSEDTDIKCTISFMMDEIRSSMNNMLVTMNLSAPDGSSTTYNAYGLYSSYGLPTFLVDAADIMYAAYKGTASELNRDNVFAALRSVRDMNANMMFTFMMLNVNVYFYDGVNECLKAGKTSDVQDMILLLLSAEEQFVIYKSIKTEDNRSQFCSNMESLKEKYNALADKTLFAEFLEMYNYYIKEYETIK